MTLRTPYVLALLSGAVLLAIALATGRLRSARATESAALVRLTDAQADARELIALRSQAERIGSGRRAPEDVTARLHSALLASGLPTSRLADYREASDTELPGHGDGPRYRRQSIRFTLAPIELPELGQFLDHWRSAEPLWTPTSIEMNRAGASRRARNTSDGYSASITIAATYVDRTGSTP